MSGPYSIVKRGNRWGVTGPSEIGWLWKFADGALEVADFLNAAYAAGRAGAYSERNYLVALLARLFPSGVRNTDIPGWDAEWHGCVYIDLPSGQISYHYHDSEAHLFAGLPPYAQEFDGHDKATVHTRLLIAVAEPAKGQVRQTLEWYEDRARFVAKVFTKDLKNADVICAVLTELALDGGRRARALLAPQTDPNAKEREDG